MSLSARPPVFSGPFSLHLDSGHSHGTPVLVMESSVRWDSRASVVYGVYWGMSLWSVRAAMRRNQMLWKVFLWDIPGRDDRARSRSGIMAAAATRASDRMASLFLG